MSERLTRRDGGNPSGNFGSATGQHAKPADAVTEGGPAPSPKEHPGEAKASQSRTEDMDSVAGDDTSKATVGKAEQRQAAEIAANKTQSGRGHRKHEGD